MVEFNFYLSSEYAKELLEGLLWKLSHNDYKGAEE